MTRKFISVLLCFVLVFGLSVSCFADYETPSGSNYRYYWYGSAGTSNFWTAMCYSAQESARISNSILDYLSNSATGLRRDLNQIYTSVYNSGNTLSSILQLMPTDYVTASDLSPISSGVSDLNTNWNSVLAGQVGTGVLVLPGIKSTLDSSYTIQSTYLPYILTASNTLNTFSPIMSSIDGSTQSIDSYTQQIDSTFDSLWSSLSTTTANVGPFYYFQRPTISNVNPAIPYKSLNADMLSMRAGWSGSFNTRVYDVNPITRSNLTLADRLTVLNDNIVTGNLMMFTAQSPYQLSKIDYSTGSSSSWSAVSIADFLYWLGNNNSDALNRLSFMFADDDDISLKNDTSDQRDWVTDYYGSSSAPSSSDYSTLNDSVGALSDMFESGSSTSFAQSLSSVNDNGYDFWSQSVSNEVNNSGTRAPSPAVIDFFSDNWEEIIDG